MNKAKNYDELKEKILKENKKIIVKTYSPETYSQKTIVSKQKLYAPKLYSENKPINPIDDYFLNEIKKRKKEGKKCL